MKKLLAWLSAWQPTVRDAAELRRPTPAIPPPPLVPRTREVTWIFLADFAEIVDRTATKRDPAWGASRREAERLSFQEVLGFVPEGEIRVVMSPEE